MNLDPIILAELQRGGPPLWISNRTYPKGWEVRSPANLQRYVRKVDGAGATDPSADAANWEPWSKTVDTTLAQLATSVANVKAVADALATSVANVKAVADAQTNTLANVKAVADAQTNTLANVKGTVDTINATPRGIKSIQRGVTNGDMNATVNNVTIAPVNLAKAYINLLTNYSSNLSNTSFSQVQVEFVNASTIKVIGQCVVPGTGSYAIPVAWEVIEEY